MIQFSSICYAEKIRHVTKEQYIFFKNVLFELNFINKWNNFLKFIFKIISQFHFGCHSINIWLLVANKKYIAYFIVKHYFPVHYKFVTIVFILFVHVCTFVRYFTMKIYFQIMCKYKFNFTFHWPLLWHFYCTFVYLAYKHAE